MYHRKKDVAYHRFTIDTTDESGDEFLRQQSYHDKKDKFIELAQAALEEVEMEEEQKGVLQELLETFLQQTGAPTALDTLFEQFHSQDVIERLAENLFEQERRNRRKSSLLRNSDTLLTPPTTPTSEKDDQQFITSTSTVLPMLTPSTTPTTEERTAFTEEEAHQELLQSSNHCPSVECIDESININTYAPNALMTSSLKEPISFSTYEKEVEEQTSTSLLLNTSTTSMLISEFVWRIFRFLILSSLVCLVYHFMCANRLVTALL
ncbi:hypothetical protein BDF20DRAFT_684980 [Mycotypha africana]|uniref:uncharacterized protein n=1 Tax=Mycotypha africana TaxID=64632 RepID=UPI00230121A7|nr:uncharacterized protein BDF20DRAFT_684980 [Mycotypha africana]KAI8971532.1 hypothetical protein BDF20DRAFT_684980 [Mycotypha africana]